MATGAMARWRTLARRLPSRFGSWVALCSTALTLIRVTVLLAEAYVTVRSERDSDARLLEICARGVAEESSKFRSLCVQARAEQAAPILFKAVLRATRQAFLEMYEAFNSPARLAALLLFLFSGLSVPLVKFFTTLVHHHLRERAQRALVYDDEEETGIAIVSGDDGGGYGRSPLDRLRALPHRLRQRKRLRALQEGLARVEEVGDSYAWLEISAGS